MENLNTEIIEKAKKWDALEKEIESFYGREVDGEFVPYTEEECEEKCYDLGTIGEAAAIAFGWL